MKKRMILLCSNIHNLGDKIKKVIEDGLGYDVLLISPEYFQQHSEVIKEIKRFGKFDLVLAIFASYHSKSIIEYLHQQKNPMYFHSWDSFSYYPKQIDYLKYFNFKSSFDPEDANEFGMKYIPNFYFEKEIVVSNKIEYDAFTIMKYDERFPKLESFAKILNSKKIKYFFLVVTSEKITSDYVTVVKDKIPISQVYDYYSKSRCIVEIGHNNESEKQGGLTFRGIEALGCKKKLITNYSFIKGYDFYDKENILIIDEINQDTINDFLLSPYKILNNEIYEKYNSVSWIKKILL